MCARAPLWRVVAFVAVACVSTALQHDTSHHTVHTLHYRLPEDFGVEHHRILGETAEGLPGVLHLVIKAIRNDATVRMHGVTTAAAQPYLRIQVSVWGTGVFEALQLESDTICRSPASFEKAPPKLVLEGRQPWPVELHLPSHQSGVPFHLHAEVQDSSHSFALKIEGWVRFAMVRPVVSEEVLPPIDASIAGPAVYAVNTTAQGFDRSMAPVVGVISPLHVNRPFQLHEFPALVGHHVQYHLRLGYSLFVVYVRPSLQLAMANSTVIQVSGVHGSMLLKQTRVPQDLVKRNRLLLIAWNSMPQHADHPYFDQELVYNHAATLFWGHNVWFSTIDVDEFLAADTELRSVRHVIADCPREPPEKAPDLLRLVRLQMDCPDCRPHWRFLEGDLVYWAQRTVPDPLKLYTRVRRSCSCPLIISHRSQQAGPYDPVFAGKYYLNPNAVGSLTPHTADMLPGAGRAVEVPSSCAYMAHLVNLIHPRRAEEGEYFNKSSTWWWTSSESELRYMQ